MSISDIINIVMAIAYMGSGVFLILGENIFNFSDFQKLGLGSLLILYGFFRLYSFIKKSKERNEIEKE